MRLVAALLALELGRGIALAAFGIAASRRLIRLDALHRSPRLDQRAIDREVLARQQPFDPGLSEDGGQELRRDLTVEQPVAVLRKARVIPDRVIHAQPDKPPEQKIELEPLHELTLRTNRD